MVMRTIPSEYYGDNTRWFVGTVINASPPAGREGRVQIRIFGIHSDTTDDIPQRDLPWAQVMVSSSSFGVSGLGVGVHILAGARVFGVFLDGTNSQLPLVLGTLPNTEYPTSVQAEGRDDIASNPFAYDFQLDMEENNLLETGNYNVSIEKAVEFFIDNGFNSKMASAMVATLQSISGLNPRNGTPESGFGIGGWKGARYARFERYSMRLLPNRDPESGDVQLMYVMNELHTTHKVAYGKLLRAQEIDGTEYGEKEDGIPIKTGMMAILEKYYVDNNTRFNEENSATQLANGIYNGLGTL
jgi:hypothetical protein